MLVSDEARGVTASVAYCDSGRLVVTLAICRNILITIAIEIINHNVFIPT